MAETSAAVLDNEPATGYEAIAKELGADTGTPEVQPGKSEPPESTTKPEGKDSETTKDGQDGEIPIAFRPKSEQDGAESQDGGSDGDLAAETEAELNKALEGVTDQAMRDNAQKGVQKLVDRLKARETELNDIQAHAEQVFSYAEGFANPEAFESAYQQLGRELYKYHGKEMPQAPMETRQNPEPDGDGESKYGLSFASDDAVLERAVQMAEERIAAKYGDPKDIAEIREMRQAEKRREAATEKAKGHLKEMQAQFGEDVTVEMIAQAISENPNMPLVRAFYASHGPTLMEWKDKYLAKLAPKGKNMIDAEAASTRKGETEKNPNSYDAIFGEMGVDMQSVVPLF